MYTSYLVKAEGVYLPRSELLGYVEPPLHDIVVRQPGLKAYVPNLLDVDLFVFWDEEKFLLLVSPEKRAHLPVRGMDTKGLSMLREVAGDWFAGYEKFVDVSALDIVQKAFVELGFTPGFAVAGSFPYKVVAGVEERGALEAVKARAGHDVAQLMQAWADKRRIEVEEARIFLSHKGINKPLVTLIDEALRSLNLRTWFDRNDLMPGDALVRTVDGAFTGCAAAVFFISGDYVDAGVIKNEVERAIHERAMRGEAFRVIPLVLAQHGGRDAHVPAPLRTLAWTTVQDVEIVPTILRALPISLQQQVKFVRQR